jgi:hypothetical protein
MTDIEIVDAVANVAEIIWCLERGFPTVTRRDCETALKKLAKAAGCHHSDVGLSENWKKA